VGIRVVVLNGADMTLSSATTYDVFTDGTSAADLTLFDDALKAVIGTNDVALISSENSEAVNGEREGVRERERRGEGRTDDDGKRERRGACGGGGDRIVRLSY
jgi:hypothetical protein